MKPLYICESITGIWTREGVESFDYSDGDEVESGLLGIMEKATDVSITSAELANAIRDWPTEYHLSGARHNLLRPFAIGPGHKVLELGCGCGAMTRYFGESGATVIAVEGSRRRAQIAAARCRDLPNVTIYCDNLIDFISEDKFDFVTLIGVLEYAPKFVRESDPVLAVLKCARSFLRDAGTLILAIENQLGLKYFNGCNEDHVGVPFFGINDLYGSHDPVTFGRRALTEKMERAGFPLQEFFYPFPDYKLPGAILNEAAFLDSRLNVADLLIHNTGRTYPETHRRVFAEDLAWRVVAENHLVADMANSFLVLARQSGAQPKSPKWLAKMYNRGRRKSSYQVETSIEENEAGRLVVRKGLIYPGMQKDTGWLRHVVKDGDYIAGELLIGRIRKAMAREAVIDEIATVFTPWVRFLLDRATVDGSGEIVMSGDYVDCIPSNMIVNTAGKLEFFDSEWHACDNIPFVWVLTRGISDALAGAMFNESVRNKSLRNFIYKVAEVSRIEVRDADIDDAIRREDALLSTCLDGHDKENGLRKIMDVQLPVVNWGIDHAERELARVKGTVSWRVTKPLRFLANLPRLIRGR